MEALLAERPWMLVALSGAVGLLAGIGMTYAWVRREYRSARRLRAELANARSELEDYRRQVNRHFQRTAGLFEGLTESYREVYAHLAAGAQALCEEPVPTLRLDLPEGKALGARDVQTEASEREGDSFTQAPASQAGQEATPGTPERPSPPT